MSIKMYNAFINAGMTPCGACGLLGNLKAESNLNPKNLQDVFNTKLGMTDEQYTKAVDDGSYTNFARDAMGYGLAQWTYWSRKQELLNHAKAVGKSIGDEDMQIEFLIREIKRYLSVWKVLITTKSVKEASNAVLLQYERPSNTGESVQAYRAKLGQEFYDKYVGKENKPVRTRSAVVNLANSWLGRNEADGSHKYIIDIYNTLKSFPRGTKMQYDWAWCACTCSAVAIKLRYTDIMPIEISCYHIIEEAKKMGIWIEEDNRVPKLGEEVLYDWDDDANYKNTDNKGVPEHIGIVVEVYKDAGYFVVVEGNYNNAVKKRTLSINGRYIRGFISPKYNDDGVVQNTQSNQQSGKSITVVAREVIAGTWGNGDARKSALKDAGYDPDKVQAEVNKILNGNAIDTTTQTPTKNVIASDSAQKYDKTIAGTYKVSGTTYLYMRHGAGTNKKAMVKLPNRTEVRCYGYYTKFNGAKWYYIQAVIDGVKYTGFSYSKYLKK